MSNGLTLYDLTALLPSWTAAYLLLCKIEKSSVQIYYIKNTKLHGNKLSASNFSSPFIIQIQTIFVFYMPTFLFDNTLNSPRHGGFLRCSAEIFLFQLLSAGGVVLCCSDFLLKIPPNVFVCVYWIQFRWYIFPLLSLFSYLETV